MVGIYRLRDGLCLSLSLMINMLPSSENNDVIPEYFLIKVPYSYRGTSDQID